MKVLLRNIKTGHYYGGNDTWVHDAARAYDCGEITRATNLALQETMPGAELMEVVLSYDQPACQLAFPLTQEWQRLWHRGADRWVAKAAA